MLRAYRRHIVDTVVECDEKAAFVPALANTFAKRVAEIPVGHDDRASGESKYNLFSLAKLSLNLITGFSLVPIQMLSITGIGISVLATMMAVALLGHRLIYGPQEEGALWTLFAVLFFFIGMIFLALGLIGEYAGRIYIEVRRRPTYIVRAVHGVDGKPAIMLHRARCEVRRVLTTAAERHGVLVRQLVIAVKDLLLVDTPGIVGLREIDLERLKGNGLSVGEAEAAHLVRVLERLRADRARGAEDEDAACQGSGVWQGRPKRRLTPTKRGRLAPPPLDKPTGPCFGHA